MTINAVYTHKHTSAIEVTEFEATNQPEFNRALAAADNEAAALFPSFSRDVETPTGDPAQLAAWLAAYEEFAEEEPEANRWKVVDSTGDEAGEYAEQPDYHTGRGEAQHAYQQLADAGRAVRLYSCHDDGEDVSEWELELMANQEQEAAQ